MSPKAFRTFCRTKLRCLDSLGYWWFVVVTSVNSLALGVGLDTSLAVKLGQTVKVYLGLLDYLDLADVAVLDGVDWLSSLDDVSGDAVGQEFLDKLWDVSVGDLTDDNLGHLLSDLLDLLGLSVGGLLDLTVVSSLGESGDENSKVVVVGGFDIDLASDHSLPFLDHGADLVSGEAHAVEVENAVLALDVFADEFELSESSSVIAKISLVAVEDSALESISGNLVTDGSGNEGLADLSDLEHSRGFDVIPILLGERVDDLLLSSLFAPLGHALIFPDCHGSILFFGSFFL